ncbi:ATP-binding protein [Sulfitobacter sp. LCG007]
MSLANKLAEERRGRLAAERMLELKQAELFAANRKLGLHARALSEEIVETRAEVAIVRDENQRVKSELSSAHQKIEVVERRLWQTIETISDCFAFYTPDLELIMANNAFLALFDGLEAIRPGVNYVTILQMMTDEGIVNPGDMRPADWRHMMTERMQQPDPEPITIRLWNREYIKLIDQRGPDGDIVSLGLNITAAVRYEEQLDEARKHAESANRAKSAFLANMSHEIRTPMNGVVGMADVLTETPLTEEQRLYVETIKNSGEALLVIINDVLDYSKIEAEKLELREEPFDLERSLHEVVMLLEPGAREKGLAIALDYQMAMPVGFLADPGRLRQVMANLVGNAIKFTNEGGIVVRVRGAPIEIGAAWRLRIEIEDTGIGIPQDKIQHIFGDFNQVENERNRKFDGTGLGLAISSRLIAMMGGELSVTSTEGQGSCFGFDIALALSQDVHVIATVRPAGISRALLLDLPGHGRNALAQHLRQLGIETLVPEDPDEARDCMATGIDILIAERELTQPGAGYERALRDISPACPVLLLTERNRLAVPEEEDGIRAHLPRPYLRQDLIDRLQILSEAVAQMPARDQTDPLVRKAHTGSAGAQDDADERPPVFLHRRADRSPSAASGPDAKADVATSRKLRPMRILAAEDNRTNQLVFSKMTKDLDIELRFASNGEEAVAAFADFAPDLIFMDISMPKMDGKQATMAIRAAESLTGGHVPIVALTAHAMEGDDESILSAGLDHYMTKPLRKAEIIGRILECAGDGVAPPLKSAPEHAAQ